MAKRDDEKKFRCLKLRPLPNGLNEDLKKIIYEQLDPFDTFNIIIVQKPNIGRAAYLNFKYIEDAEAVFAEHKSLNILGVETKLVPITQKPAAEAPTSRGPREEEERSAHDSDQEFNIGDDYNEEPRQSPPRKNTVWLNYRQRGQRGGYNRGFNRSKYSIDRRPGHQQWSNNNDNYQPDVPDQESSSIAFPPNRCLYLGYIDPEITEADLIGIFSRYGIVQSVELKRVAKNSLSGNYAFIRFFNMDMAAYAKRMMVDRYVGQSKPRIGYGSPIPTRCIWVGGIGPWMTVERLRSEFSQFGEVERVVWPDDRDYAYVEFVNSSDAQVAIGQMNGKQNLRLDMVDVALIDSSLNRDERTLSRDGKYSNQRARQSPVSDRKYQSDRTDRNRRTRSPVDYHRSDRSRGLSRSRVRRSPPTRTQHYSRRRSSERRDMPSSRRRSVSASPARDYYSDNGSPGYDSPPRNRRERRRTRSRSASLTGSPERNAKKRKRSRSSSYGRPQASSKPKNVTQNQNRDERTVVMRKNSPPISSVSNSSFVPGPQFVQMPSYPPSVSDPAPLYPPIIANPTFPPPPFFIQQPSPVPIFPSVVATTVPAHLPQTYSDLSSGQQLYNQLPPPINMTPPKTIVKSQPSNTAAAQFPKVWSGALVLKNGAFVINLHLVNGSVLLVNSLLGNSTPDSGSDCPVLKIAQRLRLDQPDKLDELDRRLRQAGRSACSVLLATPAPAEVDDVSNVIQQRPLQSLVTYLCQKEVAAVVPLPSGCTNSAKITGMLHAFPPCQFAKNFLQREAPGISASCPADDQLLVIVCESTVDNL